MKFKLNTLSSTTAALLLASNAFAGGNLDTFRFTGEFVDIDGNGDVVQLVDVVPIRWDPRCANVEYTLDTIEPNSALAAENIDIETTREQLQESFDYWNDIPTSYINMNITQVREIGNGTRGFDFINELTFETADDFTALASSPSTSLEQDTTFVAGEDVDGDGDSDIYDPEVEGINVCTDIDDDGDIEFPAGFYRAGTILDNDVQFAQNFVWVTEPDTEFTADMVGSNA